MITLKRIVNGANRGFVRLRKHVVQRLSYGGHPTLPVFVVGCQRSGTTMLQFALSQFPQVYNYGENDRPAFCDYRLARPEVIHRLIQKSRAHVLVFKPLCDSQYADNLLDEFSGRGLWIYRDYDDVINSSLRKFTQQKVVVEKLATGRWYGLGWNCERLSQHAVRTVERFYTPEMSRADACALMWYLRNLLFFERRLDVDGRVLLVKYEDLAGSADAWRAMWDNIERDAEFPPGMSSATRGVSANASLVKS